MLIGFKNNDCYNRNCSIFYRLSSFPYITLIVFKQWENSSIPIKKMLITETILLNTLYKASIVFCQIIILTKNVF